MNSRSLHAAGTGSDLTSDRRFANRVGLVENPGSIQNSRILQIRKSTLVQLLDLVIIAGYLLLTVIIGIRCGGSQSDDVEYFTGGFSRDSDPNPFRRWLSVLIVGLSIGATFFSGISMLGYPSQGYSSGVAVGLFVPVLPLACVVIVWWFLPRFFASVRIQQHPYEIIEAKMGYSVRAVAAGMYVLLRIGWMGVLIYAPVTAIMSSTSLGYEWFWPLILIIGVSSTLYTTLGGLRGVLVTDAIQFLVMGLGVVGPIIFILLDERFEFTAAMDFLRQNNRLEFADFQFDITKKFTVWSVLAGAGVAQLGVAVGDQMSIQRYMAAGSLRESQRAFLLNIVGVMIVVSLLVLLGVLLSVWYGLHPESTPAPNNDHVFPSFVTRNMPAGVPGMILAAILAATMSSMTSGINSLAGCLTMDFAARSPKYADPAARLRFARLVSVILGLSATCLAGFVAQLGEIFDVAQAVLGVFLGPLLICMGLAVTTWTVAPTAMITAMICGCIAGWGVAFSPATSLWVAPAAAAVTLLVALPGLQRSSAEADITDLETQDF